MACIWSSNLICFCKLCCKKKFTFARFHLGTQPCRKFTQVWKKLPVRLKLKEHLQTSLKPRKITHSQLQNNLANQGINPRNIPSLEKALLTTNLKRLPQVEILASSTQLQKQLHTQPGLFIELNPIREIYSVLQFSRKVAPEPIPGKIYSPDIPLNPGKIYLIP